MRGAEPPTTVDSLMPLFFGKPDFSVRHFHLTLGHYPLSPEFLRARNKPKDLSKKPAENTSRIRKSFLANRCA